MSFLKNALTDFDKEPSAYFGMKEFIEYSELSGEIETVVI